MWNWYEIARSFDFRNDAKPKTPTVSRLLIYIKALSKRQKTIKCPALALGIVPWLPEALCLKLGGGEPLVQSVENSSSRFRI
jgi:hypothetical protein